jgi:hypothetical protein
MKTQTEWPNHVLRQGIEAYSPKDDVQLYAADILAYETYLMKQREQRPTKHARASTCGNS